MSLILETSNICGCIVIRTRDLNDVGPNPPDLLETSPHFPACWKLTFAASLRACLLDAPVESSNRHGGCCIPINN